MFRKRFAAHRPAPALTVATLVSLLVVPACTGDDGDRGPKGDPADAGPTSTEYERGDDVPGINIAVVGLSGGSGPGGNFVPGDTIRVNYTIQKDDGSDWDITEMERARILVSGPTFNYSRVIPEASDLATASVRNADGSYTYTFATPIPAVYAAPYNDTASFDASDGELTGQPLLDGTYTVGLYTRWTYEVEGDSKRDAGNATFDFLVGGATAINSRQVVTQANCNRCHDELQAHGGMRREVTLCLMCHTSGSEDRNTAGATPGATVNFKVMIHKIHNGAHLPSVLGVATNANGSRNYAATPRDYVLVGFSTANFSDVHFPAFPNLAIGMPRDTGYGALTSGQKSLENSILTGVTSCEVCHGDPDGAGPLPAPAQGDLAYAQPSRASCGSCHDDIDWSLDYTSNTMTMPPQNDDSACNQCHSLADSLNAIDSHRHPLLDPAVNSGLNFEIASVLEGPDSDMNGTIEPGEGLRVTLTMQDDLGNDFDPADLNSTSLVLSGPTSNYNLLLNASLPIDQLTGAQPYVVDVIEDIYLERVGSSSAGMAGEMFTTARAPLWAGETTVYKVTALGAGENLTAAAAPYDNFLDVTDGSVFSPGNKIVVDVGEANEEYLEIQWVEDDRLWFSSSAQGGLQAGLRMAHASGVSTVDVATLVELTEGVDYTLNETTGTITELVEFGSVSVVASYTSRFLVPDEYGVALNASPDLDDATGKWTGMSLVDGTYTLTVWGYQNLSVDVHGDVTTYRGTSPPATFDFLIGPNAGAIESYPLVEMAENCASCHVDLFFHGGGRRGFEGCMACHGTSGAEDRPRYRAWGAPDTTGVQISFREMLHKIHMGEELANASAYQVIGFGSGGPPNNFTAHTYDEVVFPVLPNGVQQCSACHGDDLAFDVPTSRDHPTDQVHPSREWSTVCSACHDSNSARAHINTQIFDGYESCSTCHGDGREWNVERVHKSY